MSVPFKRYKWVAHDSEGYKYAEGEVQAMTREHAWRKAIGDAIDAQAPSTGQVLQTLEVFRMSGASEHHG